MPTLAELRRQVQHKLMAMAGLARPEQVPEPALHGHCVLLAAMVMDPSGVLARASSTDPAFVARSDQILELAARHFAVELALLEVACHQVQAAAQARGLRGAALDAWCATRLNTEFIGHPRSRRAAGVKGPR